MSISLLDVPTGAQGFVTTHWSMVLAARDESCLQADGALNDLCRAYWPPLYSFIRREGYGAAEAQDLTQEFFARVLARDYLRRWDQQRGKFRCFLLGYLKHFLLEQRGKARAQKRGGGLATVPLDTTIGEEEYLRGTIEDLSPDRIFERRWVQVLLERTLNRLAAEYAKADKTTLFEALKGFQPRQPGSAGYAQIGANLGLTVAAVKSAMQRLRHRHREILREEIAQTVTSDQELEEEIRHILEVLSW